MIPLGSLTAVHEIVNGSVTLAPSVGETADGAGGAAATARAPALTHRIIANNSVRDGRPDIRNFIIHSHDRQDNGGNYVGGKPGYSATHKLPGTQGASRTG